MTATASAVPSPLLHALERASNLTLQEVLPLDSIITRGGLEPTPDGTVAYLDGVVSQIAQVQTWLRAHPELLTVLDKGIRDEVRRMEHRVNRISILTNLGFTGLGTILGLILPALFPFFATIGH